MIFNKKGFNFPNIHSRINIESINDYKNKIDLFKKNINKNEKYSYIEFNSEYQERKKEKFVIYDYDPLFINKHNQFLNLKDYNSIESLIVEFIKENSKNQLIDFFEIKQFLSIFLKDIYHFIIIKLNFKNNITINDILSLIQNYKNEIIYNSVFLGENVFSKKTFDLYDEILERFNIMEIIEKMKLENFNIRHEEIDYKNLFFGVYPIVFNDVDEFYEKVIINSIFLSSIRGILYQSVNQQDQNNQFTKKPIFSGMKQRKIIFVIFDKGIENDNTFIFYTQLRSLGVRLIFPNNIKSTINNKYYIANTIPINFDF